MEDERMMQDIQREYLDFLDDEVRYCENSVWTPELIVFRHSTGGPRHLLHQYPHYGSG